jgi:hypothetical protein
MKAKDIEPGGEYLAGKDGAGQYSIKGRCRVIGPGDPKDVPRGSGAGKTGQRLWEVEWLDDVSRGLYGGEIKAGERAVIASTWILRPWTEEDTEARRVAAENTARSQGVAQRLMEAFDLQAPARRDRLTLVREDERTATVQVRGANRVSPEYVLTEAAVEKILAYYLEATSEPTA